MDPLPPDPYIALGVEHDADVSAIKTAYRKLALRCHPDKEPDPTLKAAKQDQFQRVQQAYEILSDDDRRRSYDDAARLKLLQDTLYKGMGSHSSSRRSPPKTYYDFNANVRTAEPPASFRPGPAPTSSPYKAGNPSFSSSWEREMPSRSKTFDDEHKPRRTPSHEKTREDSKEERKRRKEAEEQDRRRADREKERERERKELKEREKEREREKDLKLREREKAAHEAEREAQRRAAKKEHDRREKDRERDKQRRQDQDEKMRLKKAPYVEHHDESDEDRRTVKKKSSGSSGTKKHTADSPRRDKSARREGSPFAAEPPIAPTARDKTEGHLQYAAEYMQNSRRKGSKSGSSGHYPEPATFSSPQFPSPENWHPTDPPRSRRPSHEDKKFQARVEGDDDEPEVVTVAPDSAGRPPRLQKSFTSPVGSMPTPNSSATRIPPLMRASTTMDYSRTPPAAPAAPAALAADGASGGRHSSKSDRRRRGSLDEYDDSPRRPPTHYAKVVRHRIAEEDLPQVADPHFRPVDEIYYTTSASGKATFPKVKVAPSYSHEQVYQGKAYDKNDVQWAKVSHSNPSHGYQPYATYVSG